MFDDLPKSGHLIVINIHQRGCDAVALKSGDVCHIPLPDFSYTKADKMHKQLKSYLHDSGLHMRGYEASSDGTRPEREDGQVIKEILRDLWVLVVKPILKGIGCLDSPSDLPRIWWSPTGPLAFLPIHAAGIYDGSISSTLSDFAISSYTPTINSLVERVKAPRNVDPKKTGILMISQPHTPNQAPIPGTAEEVQVIQRLFEKSEMRTLCLEGATATVAEVAANMENYSCVHFACHAYQSIDDPFKNGFVLHDGWLELSSIVRKHIVGADLAFLSAGQTSMGDEKLSNEALHLAGGMLMAGYRGVVATMWPIQDKHGPRIAEDFYTNLVEHSNVLSSDEAARALHYATQNLRKTLGDSESSLLAWVPYVHFGL